MYKELYKGYIVIQGIDTPIFLEHQIHLYSNIVYKIVPSTVIINGTYSYEILEPSTGIHPSDVKWTQHSIITRERMQDLWNTHKEYIRLHKDYITAYRTTYSTVNNTTTRQYPLTPNQTYPRSV